MLPWTWWIYDRIIELILGDQHNNVILYAFHSFIHTHYGFWRDVRLTKCTNDNDVGDENEDYFVRCDIILKMRLLNIMLFLVPTPPFHGLNITYSVVPWFQCIVVNTNHHYTILSILICAFFIFIFHSRRSYEHWIDEQKKLMLITV